MSSLHCSVLPLYLLLFLINFESLANCFSLFLPFFFLGYSIFVVKGDLPDCEADQLLQMIRVQQMHRPKLIGEELAQLKEQR